MNLIRDKADGLRFGEITAALHDALADDPKPYRSNVKALLANLILYIKIYCTDEIEVYVPGRKSEVVRMRNRAGV